ncbi:MAG: hypothetical protein HGN29_03560 [Asgard group archaeon]|nr:hypothetical protein [Asgard group archaeon]
MTTVQENDSSRFSNIIVNISTVVGAILIVFYILVLLAAYNVLSLPLITDNFSAFVGLSIFGFGACMAIFAIRANFQKDFKWLSVFTILAIVLGTLGAALIILVILADLGIMASIPGITIYPNAFIILSAIVFAKWILGTVHLFFKI